MFSIVSLIVGIIIIAFHHHDDDCAGCAAPRQMPSVIHNYLPFDLKELLFGTLSRSELDNRAPPLSDPRFCLILSSAQRSLKEVRLQSISLFFNNMLFSSVQLCSIL